MRGMGAGLVVLWLGLGWVGVQAGDAEPEITGDLKVIQGPWTYETAQGERGRWVFDGDTATVEVEGQEYVAKVTLDPQTQPEPSANFTITRSPGDDLNGQTVLGIYKIDGDRLTICVGHPGYPRPERFQSGDGVRLFEMTREASSERGG